MGAEQGRENGRGRDDTDEAHGLLPDRFQIDEIIPEARPVAYAVGFRDPNYFAKAFRRHFDCSPSVYRSRLHREKRG
jgi:AraC-like DNA-binding protein